MLIKEQGKYCRRKSFFFRPNKTKSRQLSAQHIVPNNAINKIPING
jgi:hypothetical protein